jgi:hypothetical protein
MPHGEGPTASANYLPSKAWAMYRDYLSGRVPGEPNLPAKRLAILKHGRRMPQPVASDLWARRTK